MTTATHSLDTSSGSTTVAELLARNGAKAGRTPHRRSGPESSAHGRLDGTLPAFQPVEPAAPRQYRYDENTVTMLLAAVPAEPKTPGAATTSKHTGRKIAGLALMGAVLAGGWALAGAKAQPVPGPVNAEPVPTQAPEAPVAVANAAALQTIGAQSAGLVTTAAPTATAAIPATAEKAPDQGSFSGSLPAPTKAKAPAVSPAAPAPKAQQARPAPSWQQFHDQYGNNSAANAGNAQHGQGQGNGQGQGHGNGGNHHRGH